MEGVGSPPGFWEMESGKAVWCWGLLVLEDDIIKAVAGLFWVRVGLLADIRRDSRREYAALGTVRTLHFDLCLH